MVSNGPLEPSKADRESSKRKQIDRIVQSATFRQRDSLKRLLVYLADQTLDGSAEKLKEYTVGLDVFKKPEGYDPQRDGSVRQQVGKLRQKLEEYYRSEGISDPIRIALPIRTFRLSFDERKPPATSVRRPLPGRMRLIGVVVLLAAAFWAGSLWHPLPQGDLDSSVRLIWAPFLESARPTVVCLGTPLFLRSGSLRVRESHLNAIDSPESRARVAELQRKLQVDSLVPTFDYTGIGEAYAAFDISRVFAGAHRAIALSRANVLSWNEVRNENVIFLGAPKSNPHLAVLTANLQLTVDHDRQTVINAHPQPGESSTYVRADNAELNAAEDYVLVDMLPGIDSSGRILILEGGSTSSNWAAADYLTHAATASELVSRIKLPDGSLPRFFQVLLHVKYQALVPTRTEFVTFRAIRQSVS